ncbi:MAG: hypothetical protein KDB66_04840, partial [Solirubrobacterales bacterium]|nr:hypothetical protein [Solirubrobacterales bacterium]
WKLVPPDRSVTIGTAAKLRFRPSGRADLLLKCPAAEESGPCTGRFSLTTAARVRFGGSKRVVALAKGSFNAAAGSADQYRVRLKPLQRRLLKRVPKARNLLLKARVSDKAGNQARVNLPVRAVMPK